jgi:hypothetical protein
MMISLAAAALLNAAAAQPGTFAGGLQNLFFSACFDGSVQLTANDAETVQFDSLPSNLRRKLGTPNEAQVWKLRTSGNSYLYMLKFDDRNMSPRVCGLASDNLPIRPAADAVAYRLNASRDIEPQAVTREWWLADQGYMALATRVRDYTVLQVNWLSDAQRKEALRNR